MSDLFATPAQPRSMLEAQNSLARIGELRRDLARHEAEMNDELADVRGRWQEGAADAQEELAKREAGLKAYCDTYRNGLTDSGRRKFYDFPTGRVGWRVRPPMVVLRNLKNVLAAIHKLKLTEFLRVKEEVDKEAMLAHQVIAQKIPGVKIRSAGEEFYIEPREEDLGEVAS
jgi:phage host-nuclease inhibitor protein Gam